jgi:hypothetical protein
MVFAKLYIIASICVVVSSFAPARVPRTTSSWVLSSRENVFDAVELPDFDIVFEKIQQLSPLARSIIDTESTSMPTDGKFC